MLNLLPLTYDREIKDLTFFFKLLNGFFDLNISNFVCLLVIIVLVTVKILLSYLKFRRVKQVLSSRPSLTVLFLSGIVCV